MNSRRRRIVFILVRIAVAAAFLYPPIAAFFEPLSWVGYFPDFIRDLPLNETALLNIFGAVEVVIGIWILSGRRIFIPSVAATVILAGIVTFNINQFDILFRDFALMFAAAALAVWSYRGRRRERVEDHPV